MLVEALQSMFVLPGQKVKVGGVVSVTVMVWTQLVLDLPQASVAVNRRVLFSYTTLFRSVTVSLWVIVTGALQSSLAVASPVLVTLVEALQSMFVLPGQKVKLGGVVSVTVMVWTQFVFEVQPASVAVNWRVMV